MIGPTKSLSIFLILKSIAMFTIVSALILIPKKSTLILIGNKSFVALIHNLLLLISKMIYNAGTPPLIAVFEPPPSIRNNLSKILPPFAQPPVVYGNDIPSIGTFSIVILVYLKKSLNEWFLLIKSIQMPGSKLSNKELTKIALDDILSST